jgi:hypothetical protein
MLEALHDDFDSWLSKHAEQNPGIASIDTRSDG